MNFVYLMNCFTPLDYQTRIAKYFSNTSYTSLLIWLDVGCGKTFTSILCAIEGLKKKQYNNVLILCPKAVIDEFKRTVDKTCECYNVDSKLFKIVLFNSWSSATKVKKYITENTLYIIDELHLFMRSVIKSNIDKINLKNNHGNCLKIFNLISLLKHKRVIGLTGTPSAKYPFELIPFFNLNGCEFPMNIDEFNKLYILDGTLINTNTLRKLLRGMVCRIKNEIINTSPLKCVYVEMSYPQYHQYVEDYKQELQESSHAPYVNPFGIKYGSVSTFHTKTFGDCVYWDERIVMKGFNKNNCAPDSEHCPKLIKMLNDTKNINGLCVFYFKYTNIHGIEGMERVMNNNGIHKYDNSKKSGTQSEMSTYAIFSGKESSIERDRIKHIFNSFENRHGDIIKYLLLSPAGSTGITLKNVLFLGIGTIDFDYSNIRQIMGRVERIGSHNDLDVKNVDKRIYVMRKNNKYFNEFRKELLELFTRTSEGITEICPTIENIILHDAYADDKINEQFRELLSKCSNV